MHNSQCTINWRADKYKNNCELCIVNCESKRGFVMVLCKKCGVLFEEKEERCPHCGTSRIFSQVDVEGAAKKVFGTPDYTKDHHSGDIVRNKGMACLSYLSVLVVIPLILGWRSKFVRFHAMQGVVLCVAGLAVKAIADFIIKVFPIFIMKWIISIASSAVGLGIAALSVLGLIYALTGRAKEIPIAGWIMRKIRK